LNRSLPFVDSCRDLARDAWRAYEHHPWLEAMAAGTLTVEQFVSFQVNDAPYISDLHRVLAMGIAKAPVGCSWAKAAATVLDDVWVLNEIEAKRAILAELGIAVRLGTGPAHYTPAREAYANHLVRTAYEGSIGDIAAALLPCAMFTQVVGARFRDRKIPGPPAFQRWADIYVMRAVHRMAEEHAMMMELQARRTDDPGRDRMRLLYLRSVQHQVDVFDSAFELHVAWPGEALCAAADGLAGEAA
jgi:thiaminase (transcriptional activator TenA)